MRRWGDGKAHALGNNIFLLIVNKTFVIGILIGSEVASANSGGLNWRLGQGQIELHADMMGGETFLDAVNIQDTFN